MREHGRTVPLWEKNGQDRGDAVQIGNGGAHQQRAGGVKRGHMGQRVALRKRRVAVRCGIFCVGKGLRGNRAGKSCGILY